MLPIFIVKVFLLLKKQNLNISVITRINGDKIKNILIFQIIQRMTET